MEDKIHNRKYLKEYRKNLRNNSTKAESMLWKALHKKKLESRKFRRQHSIENYIVDFYCPKEKLIVELDGESHNNIINEIYDDGRTLRLKKLGFKVVRFENKLIFEQLDMVLEAIKQEFNK